MVALFILFVIGALGYMIVDGLVTGAVWVRGPRRGFSFTQIAHKRSREDEPVSYWIFMGLYSLGAVWLLYLGAKALMEGQL